VGAVVGATVGVMTYDVGIGATIPPSLLRQKTCSCSLCTVKYTPFSNYQFKTSSLKSKIAISLLPHWEDGKNGKGTT